MAQILKRTGSSSAVAAPPAIDERASHDDSSASDKDDEGVDGRVEQTKETKAAVTTVSPGAVAHDDALDASDNRSDDSKRLSLSDSLGMESADFEVRLRALLCVVSLSEPLAHSHMLWRVGRRTRKAQARAVASLARTEAHTSHVRNDPLTSGAATVWRCVWQASSLNSDKFAVNTDALGESEQRTYCSRHHSV